MFSEKVSSCTTGIRQAGRSDDLGQLRLEIPKQCLKFSPREVPAGRLLHSALTTLLLIKHSYRKML